MKYEVEGCFYTGHRTRFKKIKTKADTELEAIDAACEQFSVVYGAENPITIIKIREIAEERGRKEEYET